MNAFFKGVNMKKFTITFIAVLIFVLVTDFIIHNVLMKGMYTATANLWRTEAEMHALMGWMVLSHIFIAFFFTLIFIKGYEGKGLAEGARFGVLIGLYNVGCTLMQYVVTPITCEIATWWAITGLIQAVLGGMLAAFVFKRK